MPNRSKRDSASGRPGRPFNRDAPLRPGVGIRSERRTVLIVTNGERTEVEYFKALRKESWVSARVIVKFEKGDPAALVTRAAAIRDDSDFDEAWVVSDLDEFDIKPALALAQDRGVELAISVPCFEVWLILHLSEGCPSCNNAHQVGAHLKKLVPTWDKTALKFDIFRARVFDASARAQRLGDPPDANPSTYVWRLIESLRAPSDQRSKH